MIRCIVVFDVYDDSVASSSEAFFLQRIVFVSIGDSVAAEDGRSLETDKEPG